MAGDLVRLWNAHEIAMRMLNNLVAAYQRRGDLANELRAAKMRLALPVVKPRLRAALEADLQAVQA